MHKTRTIKVFWMLYLIYFGIVSIGLPLHKHFCEGVLKKTQWIFEPESCHKTTEIEKSCCNCCDDYFPKECNFSISEDNKCCENNVVFIKADINSVLNDIDKSENNNSISFQFIDCKLYFQNITIPYLLHFIIKSKIPLISGIKIIILKNSFLC